MFMATMRTKARSSTGTEMLEIASFKSARPILEKRNPRTQIDMAAAAMSHIALLFLLGLGEFCVFASAFRPFLAFFYGGIIKESNEGIVSSYVCFNNYVTVGRKRK